MTINGLLPNAWQDWQVEKFKEVHETWNKKIKDIDFNIRFNDSTNMCELQFHSVEFGYKITSYYCNIHEVLDILELIIRLK